MENLENCLYQCKICGKLFLLNKNIFINNESNLNINKKRNENKKIILFKNLNKLNYIKEFKEFQNLLNKFDFPFCSNCSVFIQQRILSINKLIYHQIEELTKISLQPLTILISTPVRLIDSTKKQIEAMNDTLNKKIEPRISINNFIDIIQPKKNNKNLKEFLPKSSIYLICNIFYIGHFGHYGTINGIKIGINLNDNLSKNELNNGLFMIGHLVYLLNKYLNKEINNLEINTNIILYENGENPIQFYLKSFEIQKINNFNIALNRFFNIIYSLYTINGQYDPLITPPFLINLNSKTINGLKYEIDIQNPNLWAEPMKLLLLDLKIIQTKLSSL